MSPLIDIVGALKAGVEAGLKDAGEHILDVARAEAPVDTGELRDSGEVTASGNRVDIAFTAGHAMYVHENMTDNYTAGGPKFLEKALTSEADTAARLIGEAIRKQLGG